MKSDQPLAVQTITLKVGLLCMLALLWIYGSVCMHSFKRGAWVMRTGFALWLVEAAKKLIFGIATDILVDSPSLRDFLIE